MVNSSFSYLADLNFYNIPLINSYWILSAGDKLDFTLEDGLI